MWKWTSPTILRSQTLRGRWKAAGPSDPVCSSAWDREKAEGKKRPAERRWGVFPIVIFAMWGAQVPERHQEDSVTVQYLLLNPALEIYLPVYLMRFHVRCTAGYWVSLLA